MAAGVLFEACDLTRDDDARGHAFFEDAFDQSGYLGYAVDFVLLFCHLADYTKSLIFINRFELICLLLYRNRPIWGDLFFFVLRWGIIGPGIGDFEGLFRFFTFWGVYRF